MWQGETLVELLKALEPFVTLAVWAWVMLRFARWYSDAPQ